MRWVPNIQIFPKGESALGVGFEQEFLQLTALVARGDLGVEVPAAEVPHIQKTVIRSATMLTKPVITATPDAHYDSANPRPTRCRGYGRYTASTTALTASCFLVSLRSEYPVEAVKTMASICKETEKYLPVKDVYHQRG